MAKFKKILEEQRDELMGNAQKTLSETLGSSGALRQIGRKHGLPDAVVQQAPVDRLAVATIMAGVSKVSFSNGARWGGTDLELDVRPEESATLTGFEESCRIRGNFLETGSSDEST